MEALSRVMALVDKSADKMGDGVYLEVCDEMKKLYDYLKNDPEPIEYQDEYQLMQRLNVYSGIDFMEEVNEYILSNPSRCEKFLRENKEIKRMTDKRRKEAIYWYCYTHRGEPWKNMNWLDLENEVGFMINSLHITVHLAYKDFYNQQIQRVKEKLENSV